MSLLPHHRNQLVDGSGIDPEVVAERGYSSIHRGSQNDAAEGLRKLKALGIPKAGRDADSRLPGLLIPQHRPTGEHISVLWRPDNPPRDAATGKQRKYLQPFRRPAVLDVHPRSVAAMADPTVPLWVTEGVKKADALVSRGAAVVALSGVYNWRSTMGTLGDWEDVQLRGREVVVCFDSDARTNPNVLRAMVRLGRWLRSKGARPVYLITPAEFAGRPTKGADDYLVAGGTLEQLRAAGSSKEPATTNTDGSFSDAQMAETLADDVLTGAYVWSKGLGWLAWTGIRWQECSDETVIEAARCWVLGQFAEVIEQARTSDGQWGNTNPIDGWRSMLTAGRMRAVLGLARGIVERRAEEFDAHPDLINTPSGIVDLRAAELGPHDPDLYLTKVTSGSYRPGFTHPDWTAALTALPADVADWLQVRLGQGATGHPTPDGRLLVLQGGGSNGKSVMTTDGVLPALGDYGAPASQKLFMSTKGSEHSTEMADLRGQRLLVAEELTEGRSIDVTALKRIQDVGQIKARFVHKDNFTFRATHSLLCTTNYVPVINETDHGTWRRLALVRFPYRFMKPGEQSEADTDRPGDPTLKGRLAANRDGQHDAIVTWLVEGARRWYADEDGQGGMLEPPAIVAADTRAWRSDADRVLGFWLEHLTPDADRCVWAVDLLARFNGWLSANGHNPWPKETFHPRFRAHEETARHRVSERRTVALAGLSRPEPKGFNGLPEVPRQAVVYMGVRFRDASELQECAALQTLQTPRENPSYTRDKGSFPTGLQGPQGTPVCACGAHLYRDDVRVGDGRCARCRAA